MLKVLHNINTLLTIRLNLYEELPPHLQSFSVKSGRATFVIPGEFELDISIADEDPLARFYFIDFRFLCRPAPELPDGHFRNFLEVKCNEILESSGLSGCYDFLHNFVLTHKIRTLRKQAFEMIRGEWAESLRVEDAHRMLIVQYWVGMPGHKSWLEIGLESGNLDHSQKSWKGPGTPKLGVRWMRNGSHVKDASLNFDWMNLSMERMMKKVVALHSNYILSSIHDQLRALTPESGASISIETSETDSIDCALSVQLRNAAETTTVKIEPFTGFFSLKPWSPVSARVAFELNGLRNPAADGAAKVAHQSCLHHQLRIERQAEQFGWTILRNLDLKADHIRTVFRQKSNHTSFFRVHGWEPSWAIVVTVGMGGESWWVVKL
jgi:mediator of RNA polymerase II transcription subunit 14